MVDIGASAAFLPATRGLPRSSVYRSVTGRSIAARLYDEALARLPYRVEFRSVCTSFGQTHLTIGGRHDGRPLIVIPGMSASGPITMDFFAVCARTRLLIALDLIGQPGRSEDRVHSAKGHGLGLWLAEILNALQIDRADIAAPSFGASVALDLAVIDPRRVGKLALLMPAGLTPRLPYAALACQFFLPWIIHRYVPLRQRLPRLARHLGASLTEYDYRYLDMVIRHTAFWRHRPAGPFFADDLASYRRGVFLVTAGLDRVLPSRSTRANAFRALRIAEEVYLPQSMHMPAAADMTSVHRRIADYFG